MFCHLEKSVFSLKPPSPCDDLYELCFVLSAELTTALPPTIELSGRGYITIESAIEEEENVINWPSYGPATDKLYQ